MCLSKEVNSYIYAIALDFLVEDFCLQSRIYISRDYDLLDVKKSIIELEKATILSEFISYISPG